MIQLEFDFWDEKLHDFTCGKNWYFLTDTVYRKRNVLTVDIIKEAVKRPKAESIIYEES